MTDRRGFLASLVRGATLVALGGVLGYAGRSAPARRTVWQIDPQKCIQCGRCATECVLRPSAVKCVHEYGLCGYCDLCTGYFEPEPLALHEGAENQLCPLGAIDRRFVEEPFYEYNIEEDLCVGCGKCVKGCGLFGNGSLILQVRHHLCVNCNDCRIARACPAGAVVRVPAAEPYRLRLPARSGA